MTRRCRRDAGMDCVGDSAPSAAAGLGHGQARSVVAVDLKLQDAAEPAARISAGNARNRERPIPDRPPERHAVDEVPGELAEDLPADVHDDSVCHAAGNRIRPAVAEPDAQKPTERADGRQHIEPRAPGIRVQRRRLDRPRGAELVPGDGQVADHSDQRAAPVLGAAARDRFSLV